MAKYFKLMSQFWNLISVTVLMFKVWPYRCRQKYAGALGLKCLANLITDKIRIKFSSLLALICKEPQFYVCYILFQITWMNDWGQTIHWPIISSRKCPWWVSASPIPTADLCPHQTFSDSNKRLRFSPERLWWPKNSWEENRQKQDPWVMISPSSMNYVEVR